jgi:5-methylcytosine-specific restriction protein B
VTDSTLKILYGPPGTGKTWRAAREAVELLKPGTKPDDVMQVHGDLVNSGQIIWVTFHPSYTYEDFVEGFRPEATKEGILYVPRSGPFRIACANVTLSPPPGVSFYVGQILNPTKTAQEYEVIQAGVDTVVLKITKGKGVGNITPVSLFVIDRLRAAGFKPGDTSLGGDQTDKQKLVVSAVGIDKQTLFGNTGPMRAVWEYLESASPPVDDRRPVVLVIDEINRADLSRVFGELITLLEPDKRLGQPEERRVLLPYSQTLFGVPPELHIVGTMNTWDRSLAVIDGALRRRFHFEEVAPDPTRCASPYGGVDLPAILSSWNLALGALASPEVRIGHAYFEKDALERRRELKKYAADEGGELKTVAATLRDSILPLLADVLRQDWRAVDFVLGRDYAAGKGGLISEVPLAAIQARGGDVVDVSGAAEFVPAAWSDPDGADWDADKFKAAISNAAS